MMTTIQKMIESTVGDFLDKPIAKGGLDISRPLASAILAAIVIAGVLLASKKAGNH
jgi:uncharacterized membrane-anchored protein